MSCEHSRSVQSNSGGELCSSCALSAIGTAVGHYRATQEDHDDRPPNKYYSDSFMTSSLNKLCEPCQKLFLHPPMIWASFRDVGPKFPPLGNRYWNDHHGSFYELKQCAENFHSTCDLCVLVSWVVTHSDQLIPELKKKGCWDGPNTQLPPVRVAVERFLDGVLEDNPLLLIVDFGEDLPYVKFRMIPLASHEDDFLRILSGPSTSSKESFILAKQWLGNCINKHPGCSKIQNEADSNWLPTRLVYVGSSGLENDARLKLSHEIDGNSPYLALSHCWGGADIYKLKSTNFQDMVEKIPIQKLGKTFLDALTITRTLGFRYIWIDSLCILQDSKDDWVKEAALMGKVYKYSTCTIAATGSSSSNGGCFFDRLPWMPQCKIEANPFSEVKANIKGEALVLVAQNWDNHWSLFLDSYAPLNSRGWTFQERILSPRILHFGRGGISWECNTLCASEYCQNGFPLGDFYFEKRPEKPRLDEEDVHSLIDPIGHNSHIWAKWIQFVEDYSERNLTFATDKLIALSAVAKEIQSQLKDDYFAGLWRKTMLFDLCWQVDYEQVLDETFKSFEYSAPSWSWASTRFPVFYPFTPQNLRKLVTRFWSQILDVDVTPAHADPLGQVCGGRITIEGLLKLAIVVPGKLNEMPRGVLHTLTDTKRKPLPFTAWISMDGLTATSADTSIPVTCLPILYLVNPCENVIPSIQNKPNVGKVFALLLQPVQGKELEYTRVGFLYGDKITEGDNWFHIRNTDNSTGPTVPGQQIEQSSPEKPRKGLLKMFNKHHRHIRDTGKDSRILPQVVTIV